MFYLVIILFAVGWIMVSVVIDYVKGIIGNKYTAHGILAFTPVLVLILMVSPILEH